MLQMKQIQHTDDHNDGIQMIIMSKVTYWTQYGLWKQNLLLHNLGKINKSMDLSV